MLLKDHFFFYFSDITLFWKMNYKADQFEAIKLYEVYGYQEKKNLSDMHRKRPSMLWKKVGGNTIFATPYTQHTQLRVPATDTRVNQTN